MASVMPDRRQVNVRQVFESTLAEAHQALLCRLSTRMTNLLNQAVDHLLGRERYERRGHAPDDIQGGECRHCHTRQSDHFTRHGGRKRTVTIWWGDLQVRWPRAMCACGHCIQLNLAAGWRPISGWVRTSMS